MKFPSEMRAEAENVIMRATDRHNKTDIPTSLEVRLAGYVLTLSEAVDFADPRIAKFSDEEWKEFCQDVGIKLQRSSELRGR